MFFFNSTIKFSDLINPFVIMYLVIPSVQQRKQNKSKSIVLDRITIKARMMINLQKFALVEYVSETQKKYNNQSYCFYVCLLFLLLLWFLISLSQYLTVLSA